MKRFQNPSLGLLVVTIEDNSTIWSIGAGAVATKNVPANVVAVGHPARVITDFSPIHNLDLSRIMDWSYWDNSIESSSIEFLRTDVWKTGKLSVFHKLPVTFLYMFLELCALTLIGVTQLNEMRVDLQSTDSIHSFNLALRFDRTGVFLVG